MKSKDQQLLEEAYNEVSKERLLSRIKPEFRKLYVKDLEHFNGSYRDRADVLNKAKQMGHLVEEAYDKISGEWKQYDSLAVGDFVKYYDPSQELENYLSARD